MLQKVGIGALLADTATRDGSGTADTLVLCFKDRQSEDTVVFRVHSAVLGLDSGMRKMLFEGACGGCVGCGRW